MTELNDRHQKETISFEDKLRLSENKAREALKKAKDEMEEKRKIKQLMQEREIYYKHEKKKLESTIEKLREKMNNITANKSLCQSSLDLNENLTQKKKLTRNDNLKYKFYLI